MVTEPLGLVMLFFVGLGIVVGNLFIRKITRINV
jgi:hypothetical protein